MKANSNITIGIDEVGRGPWAGPLLVSAVALDMNRSYDGLADSKKLTKKRRQSESVYIKQCALGIGLGWVNANELDRLGMTKALKLGARRAYEQIDQSIRAIARRIVIDGNINMLDDDRATVLVKADAKVQAVSAASIVAKVARDNYMLRLGQLYPGYGFERHSGYGTKAHLEALYKYGAIPGIHRLSFAPIKKLLGVDDSHDMSNVSPTAIGRVAESVATDYLLAHGYRIVSRNWRTKLCEIDIVASKGRELLFVEVKYRKQADHGDGLAAMTDIKRRQVRFAAQIFLHDNPKFAKSMSPRIMVVSLHGDPPVVDGVILDDDITFQ